MSDAFFLGCFFFGALFTVASAAVGAVGTHAGPFHGHAHGGGHAHGPWRVLALLNVSAIVAFLCWFGAAGYILAHYVHWAIATSALAGLPAGGAGGYLVHAFFAKIRAGDSELDPADFRLEGTRARVTVSIPPAGTGEITFTLQGAIRAEPARANEGQALARDTAVVVLGFERGIALVAPIDGPVLPA